MEGKKILHITNGDDLSSQIPELDIPGDVITWREMLCEGPASMDVGDENFVLLRKIFLLEKYKVSEEDYQKEFLQELVKLAAINKYDEIVLWFEFDLFSHMNMLALISFLLQNKKTGPFSLVCSRKLKGEEEMTPLSQLSPKNQIEHYKQRIPLTDEDIQTAQLIWELYCSNKPKRLASEIKKTTNFEYLSSCIRAHIERFPSVKTGLNTLEVNVLRLIDEHEIKSMNHLLGYALQYQGYYGYVDIQMQRVLEKLSPFYEASEDGIKLNDDGLKALSGTKNYYQNLKDDEFYGGVRKYDFLYDPENHDLLKL
ncbi:DUF1835 domain-containing protein [Salinimicrobium sp. HB62]|uniref:DUF1835 domain-containing protein n=1 Tax=Salinimicrobium sp. HB62 TaxID=3077781 RepID=UPI002D78F32F|nr:DUF1835 domain-containing protein [Salinimicrobium sp. HB62]